MIGPSLHDPILKESDHQAGRLSAPRAPEHEADVRTAPRPAVRGTTCHDFSDHGEDPRDNEAGGARLHGHLRDLRIRISAVAGGGTVPPSSPRPPQVGCGSEWSVAPGARSRSVTAASSGEANSSRSITASPTSSPSSSDSP